MTWNPKNNSIDVSKIIDNLFAFLEAEQTEALAFIKGADSIDLPDWKKFYKSSAGRITTIFPLLMLIKREAATDFSSDVLSVGLRLTFEALIQGGNKDLIVLQADKYAAALESMLINVPPEVLTANVFNIVDSIESEIETEFDFLRGNRANKPTTFLQGFQTQITYILKGESY